MSGHLCSQDSRRVPRHSKSCLKDFKKRKWKRQIHFFISLNMWSSDLTLECGLGRERRNQSSAIWEEWRLLCSLCFHLDVLSCEIRSFFPFKNFERDNLWRHGSYKQFRSWPCPFFFFFYFYFSLVGYFKSNHLTSIIIIALCIFFISIANLHPSGELGEERAGSSLLTVFMEQVRATDG